MTEEHPAPQHRTVFSLSYGARICLLLGALLLLASGYLFWSPIGTSVPDAFPASCGSAASPPRDSLGKAVCGSLNEQREAQAAAALGAAVVVILGGLLAFGVKRVAQPRKA